MHDNIRPQNPFANRKEFRAPVICGGLMAYIYLWADDAEQADRFFDDIVGNRTTVISVEELKDDEDV